MVNRTIEDFNRRNISFEAPKIVDILPDYFKEDYPKLITLLEAYMDFLDSDGGFNDKLRNVLKARDIDGVSLQFLDYILVETGMGITGDKFIDPREITRNFPDFFRYKGSLFSAQSFFRALYGEEIEVSYPKDQLFIVGESEIGPESLKLIQNGKLYQVLSILIKSSRSISEWRTLYKRYVHPAGFYLGSEVLAEGIVNLNYNTMPDAILDSDINTLIVSDDATLTISGVSDPLTIITSPYNSDSVYRSSIVKTIEEYASVTLDDGSTQYPNVFEASKANGPRMSGQPTIDWSNTFETLDESRYIIDSSSPIEWIMQYGIWNDFGIWDDSNTWIDSV